MARDILFIHGAFTRAARWDPWLAYFTDAGYRCVAPSLPGHDPPDPAALATLTFSDYVAAVADVHAALASPPIVIGHSMGGLIAQHLAAGTECAALVLVSSSPPWATRGTRYALPYLASYVLPVIAGRPIRANPNAALKLVLHDLSVPEQEAQLPTFAFESGKAYRTVVFGRAPLAAGAIRCPVLCVNGGADRMLAKSVGGTLAAFYEADHIVFDGHGHGLVADSLVTTVAAAVRDWLDRRSVTAGGDASRCAQAVV